MYKNIVLLATLVASVLVISSCGGVDCEDPGLFDEFNRLQTEANTLGLQLPTDPTVCNEFRNVTQDLIDEANDIIDCVNADQAAQFMNNIAAAEANLANLTCG